MGITIKKERIKKMKFFGVVALYAQANGESASKFQDAANDIKNVLDITLDGVQKVAESLSSIKVDIPEFKFEAPKIDIPEFKYEAPEIVIPDMGDFKVEVPEIKVPGVDIPEFEMPEINIPEMANMDYKFDDSELKEQLKNL